MSRSRIFISRRRDFHERGLKKKKRENKIIEWRKNARRWRESHDPCGQLWRNYRHPVYKERKFVSGSIGAKLAWTLKVISLSGLREDDGSDENLGPLINAGGFLCTVHTKPSNKRSPALYWPRTKLARGFSGTRESSGITKLTVLCPLLYHEIGLLKRYYESVLPFRIYHSVEPRVNLINDPGQTVSSFDWTKSNWTRSGHRSRVLSQLSSIILNILTRISSLITLHRWKRRNYSNLRIKFENREMCLLYIWDFCYFDYFSWREEYICNLVCNEKSKRYMKFGGRKMELIFDELILAT